MNSFGLRRIRWLLQQIAYGASFFVTKKLFSFSLWMEAGPQVAFVILGRDICHPLRLSSASFGIRSGTRLTRALVINNCVLTSVNQFRLWLAHYNQMSGQRVKTLLDGLSLDLVRSFKLFFECLNISGLLLMEERFQISSNFTAV